MRLVRWAAQRPDLLRAALVGGALFVFTNGPLFFLTLRVLNRQGPTWEELLGRPEPRLESGRPRLDAYGPAWEDLVVRSGLLITAVGCVSLVGWSLWRSRGRRPAPPHSPAAAAVLAFTAVVAASTAWSVVPGFTGWRSVVMVGLVLLAWELADARDSDAGLALTLMSAAAVGTGLLLFAIHPQGALDHRGDMLGIYLSRNLLAPLAAVGVIAGVRLALEQPRRTRIAGACLAAASLGSMIGAGSRTAWLALAAGAGLAALPVLNLRLAARWGPRRAAAVCWGTLVASTAVAAAAVVAMWSVSTLSQRRTIWSVSWEQFLERPLEGHGFAAVWTLADFIDDHELLIRGNAHSSIVEVLLGTGVLGLVPFAAIVVLAVRNAGLDLLRRPSPDTWMWAAVVAVMLIENVTESFIIRLSYNWVIVMAAALRKPEGSAPGQLASSRIGSVAQASRLWAAYSSWSRPPATSAPASTAATRAVSTRRKGSKSKLTTTAKAAMPATQPATARRV